jgi:hypothetical protein
MAASLDKLEGELVEAAGLLVLVLIAITIFNSQSSSSSGGILAGAQGAVSSLFGWIGGLFSGSPGQPGGSSQPGQGPVLPDSGSLNYVGITPTNELSQAGLQAAGFAPPDSTISVPAGTPLNQTVVSGDPTDTVLTPLILSGMPMPF